MSARYVVLQEVNDQGDFVDSWWWHKQAGNGQVTVASEMFTRHESAVRAIRADLEASAEILGVTLGFYFANVAPTLTYLDLTEYDDNGAPEFTEKPLYAKSKASR